MSRTTKRELSSATPTATAATTIGEMLTYGTISMVPPTLSCISNPAVHLTAARTMTNENGNKRVFSVTLRFSTRLADCETDALASGGALSKFKHKLDKHRAIDHLRGACASLMKEEVHAPAEIADDSGQPLDQGDVFVCLGGPNMPVVRMTVAVDAVTVH